MKTKNSNPKKKLVGEVTVAILTNNHPQTKLEYRNRSYYSTIHFLSPIQSCLGGPRFVSFRTVKLPSLV